MKPTPRNITVILLVALAAVAVAWVALRDSPNGGNTNIAFFGRVVDQQGSPVPGVVVTAELTRKAGPELPILWTNPNNKYEVVTASTDSQGLFAFKLRGIGLLIKSVEKPGYVSSRANTGNVEYLRPKEQWYGPLRPDPAKPYTFTLRRESTQ